MYDRVAEFDNLINQVLDTIPEKEKRNKVQMKYLNFLIKFTRYLIVETDA